MSYHGRMSELVFEVVQEADGGYCAECLTENIFTEGNTWDELRRNVVEATTAFFFDRPRPAQIRLQPKKRLSRSISGWLRVKRAKSRRSGEKRQPSALQNRSARAI